jgi:hypothetical protein
MDSITKLGYVLIGLLFLVPAVRSIFKFFGISQSLYMPYLLWVIALLLFYGFLPPRVGEMFDF